MSKNVEVVNLSKSDDRFDVAAQIIEQEIASQPIEVKRAVAWYAGGNLGAARLIAHQCKMFTSPAEVEQLIGWPMAGERQEQGDELYRRFKHVERRTG